MLSSNLIKYENTKHDYVYKILDAQTASGYCITKKFATILLENYKQSEKLLIEENYPKHEYCFDIYFKKLQIDYNWYFINPRIGKQIISFSDIEKKLQIMVVDNKFKNKNSPINNFNFK